MKLLAIETSSDFGSVALMGDEGIIGEISWCREKSHSELLSLKISQLLESCSLNISEVTQLAVGVGPGSFTGIRVAVNAARTLSYALNIPCWSFSTHEMLTFANSSHKEPILSLVPAHRNLVYVAVGRINSLNEVELLFAPSAIEIERLAELVHSPMICVGEGYNEWNDLFTPELRAKVARPKDSIDVPSAIHLAQMATLLMRSHSPMDWKSIQGLYIRGSEAEEKLRDGTLQQQIKIV